jgi:hypothetical protein
MSSQQLKVVERARAKYGAIYPCSGRTALTECFTQERGQVIFWFNSKDNSTHIETERKV